MITKITPIALDAAVLASPPKQSRRAPGHLARLIGHARRIRAKLKSMGHVCTASGKYCPKSILYDTE